MQTVVMAVSLFQSNTILVWDEKTMGGIVFDPGGEASRILAEIEARKIQVKAVLLTHGHIDHVGAAAKVKEKTGAKVYIHELDAVMLKALAAQCLMFGVPIADAPSVDANVKEGDELTIDSLKLKVLHTPGHTQGSVVYQFLEPEKLLISGDLLFAGSIGRMDLPGGNEESMKKSLERMTKLPDDLTVIPGHGAKTTIGREKAGNPYLAGGMFRW